MTTTTNATTTNHQHEGVTTMSTSPELDRPEVDLPATDLPEASQSGPDSAPEAADPLADAQARADAAEARAVAAEAALAQMQDQKVRAAVARKTGLPAALTDRLRGSTEAELQADAEALLAALRGPVDLGQGGRGGAPVPRSLDPVGDALRRR